MLSRQQLTFVSSLQQKKFRQMYGKFLVEGDKLVRELLTSNFQVDVIYRLQGSDFQPSNTEVPIVDVSESDLKKISTHQQPDKVVAVAEIPAGYYAPVVSKIETELVLVCDQLNDPGNAGTILRSAEWFGIKQVIFSQNSVDVFNPKTVSAAKGSLFRVKCRYADLTALFKTNSHIPVYGAVMDGSNIYTTKLESCGFILLGNEANGISTLLLPYIHHAVSIPSYGNAESLNVAMAATVILSEFKRRNC